ncbi:Subunit of the RNA polymerase II mediator complex [Komagataella phaffii GS115]|uniref:Mediator of RNA polymerase II transcription subunit 10 n=2 Tax=Komagataella phaffii TaxID=460519 RepID=C4R3P4_KOMPG|nr:Subunit of the RNA polymerase II mediator complex [Komagataella phaffii GS115]AOA63399.1 GQ67_03169T0 [Komagataella phaffii]AOA68795.1 GQ68_03154T0 [Komagataella phaffii GS115]CAY70105.1 Subunit of the RNA polymerase II mediator complex [Komagataella phaffii GS115]
MTSMSAPATTLDQVENELSQLIETLIHLGVQVHDYAGTAESQLGLSNNINKVVEHLQKLHNTDLNIPIPVDVVNYIEDGRNPDIYTREFVEVVRKLNQFLRGKQLGFKYAQSTLGQKIVNEFPELKEQVENIKKRTFIETVPMGTNSS